MMHKTYGGIPLKELSKLAKTVGRRGRCSITSMPFKKTKNLGNCLSTKGASFPEVLFFCELFVIFLRSEEYEQQNAYQHQYRIIKVRDQLEW